VSCRPPCMSCWPCSLHTSERIRGQQHPQGEAVAPTMLQFAQVDCIVSPFSACAAQDRERQLPCFMSLLVVFWKLFQA